MSYNRDIELVGILASDEDVQRINGKENAESVFINKNGDIQYYVKALSENSQQLLFTGYIDSIKSDDSESLDSYSDKESRIRHFKENLSNKLFLFTYYVRQQGQMSYYKLSKAMLVNCPATINEKLVTIATPVFSPKHLTMEWENKNINLNRHYDTYDEFIDLLKNNRTIGSVAKFDSRDDFPRFIIWDDGDKFCAVGPFTRLLDTKSSDFAFEYTEVYEYDLSELLDYMVYEDTINPTLLHMRENTYILVHDSLVNGEGKLLFSSGLDCNSNIEGVDEVCNLDLVGDESQVVNVEKLDLIPITIDTKQKDDKCLLEIFRMFCEDSSLYYDNKDLVNFHTAMKTGNLVILSGMSGTGKSAIVDVYAKALGITTNLLTIPVRPSWNDDSDLIGYVDLIHRVYRPSDTGFVKLLVEASKIENQNKLYIVCFDEMNLARVEHYFSQFLSILEKPVGQRVLRLYDSQYIGGLYNSSEYPHEIEIHDNIRFVGTVNVDESTYHFADKVLDRANVINLKVLNYSNCWIKNKYNFTTKVNWSKNDYVNLIKNENVAIEDVRKFLWDLHLVLNGTYDGFGIGPRVVISIEKYLSNLPSNDDFTLTKEEGLDYQVQQRILTKLRGPEEQIGDLLADSSNEKSINYIFERYKELSDFEFSKKVLLKKKREIKIYGYCL